METFLFLLKRDILLCNVFLFLYCGRLTLSYSEWEGIPGQTPIERLYSLHFSFGVQSNKMAAFSVHNLDLD